MPSTPYWFDAHLDLACIALLGRDMHAPLATCGGPWPPPAVTLPSLRDGNVRSVLATIFTEAGGTDTGISYETGNAQQAHAAGVAQLGVYDAWIKQGAWSRATSSTSESASLRFRLLMECADPIRDPSELAWWADQGVAAIGLAWARGSRYAGGNSTGGPLTPIGRELVREMDRLRVIHDISHLSDEALANLLSTTDRTIIASHSNCRSLIDLPTDTPRQRHLTDDTIREIARRNGVIGLNLFSLFLTPGALDRRATIAETLAHIEHICMLTGSTNHVGLGSDMDGGLRGDQLPQGINQPADLTLLTEGLRARGWNDTSIAAFMHTNWERIFGP
ncbi:MAG TPA: membrane dipeptidase [Phycisphaerales bacterium]|nr:membrane dipeptidase [Phycisphaerales bacterium]